MLISETRGIRNNNPGNLDFSKSFQYKGEVIPSRDTRFCTFETMAMGVRALAMDLLAYPKHGCVTISDFVSRYAPPSENNTAAYIDGVCMYLNHSLKPLIPYSGKSKAKLNDTRFLDAFVSAFIVHEEGMKAFTAFVKPGDIIAGVDMALHGNA